MRDSAALLDATSGPDVGDPYWAPPPAGPFLAEVGRDPGRLRIALTVTPWITSPVDPECAAAAHAAAKLCASLGHGVEEARPVIDEKTWREATRVIVAANITFNLEARAAALGRSLAEGDVERMTWDRVLDARTMTAAQYAGSIGVVHRVGRTVARFFEGYDVILSPTMCAPPQPLGVLDMSTEHPDRYLAAVFASIGFTSLFNSSGHPAMTRAAGDLDQGVAAGRAVRRALWRRGHAPAAGRPAGGRAALGQPPANSASRSRCGGAPLGKSPRRDRSASPLG